MSARTFIKNSVKAAAYCVSPLLSNPRPASRILTYHSIGDLDHAMNVRPHAFAEQMAWIADHCALLRLGDAADAKPGIAITFDDGYRDNLTNAAPILVKHAIPATVFVVAERLGGPLMPDADTEHGKLMTWDEVRELAAMGIDIGGHTMTHPRLSHLPEEVQRHEIVGCCRLIADQLGRAVRHFAYPYGTSADYNAVSMRLAEEAGCIAAYSNRYGYNTTSTGRYELRRIWIDASDSLKTFQRKVIGALDTLQLLESPAALRLRKAFSRIG